MKFLRTIFLNTPEEIAQLHLVMVADGVNMTQVPQYASAQVHGDERQPQRIELYRLRRPEHNHQAVAELVRSAGRLELQPLPRKGTIL